MTPMALAICLQLGPDAPRPWACEPVAARLHPVGFDYGVRYQELVEARMGGAHGSPALAPTVAEADVHWRLYAATGEGLPMGVETAERWRDTAVSGSLLALSTLVNETFARDEHLTILQTVLDTAINPSIDIARRPSGVVVEHRVEAPIERRLDRDELEIALPERRRQTRLRAGADWRFREEEDALATPTLEYAAFLSTENLGLSRLRADYSLFDRQWSLAARQEVLPRVYVTGSARSRESKGGKPPLEGIPELGRVSAGLLWQLPYTNNWNVRLERITTMEAAEVTWMVTLRGENRTAIPARASHSLGEVAPGGLSLPSVPDRGANTLRPWF